MRTKGNKKKQVNIITLGCSKNQVDSEALLAQLQGGGITAAHGETPSDIVIINTCGFIENAKQESINTILQFAQAKEEGLVEKVYVTGCLSERYQQQLKEEIPQVDAWYGTRDMSRLLKQLRTNFKQELVGERVLANPCHYAYLKISEGCDRPCSFCAIPLMRGKHVSRPVEELVKEATSLARQGVKELLIIAQDSTYYGLDLYKKRNLAYLLETLSDIESIAWIRLHYAFPTGFPMDVLDVMARNPKICRYLDVPLQHAATSILQKMRRGTTREKTEALLTEIRQRVPGIALRTTMIVGHPGETPQEFDELIDFVQHQRFERLGGFTYSHEENTHAYTMSDNVAPQEKKRRLEELMSVQEDISFALNQQKLGRTFSVIIDRKEGELYVGRTEFDSPEVDNEVIIKTDAVLSFGQFVEATITEASAFDLTASLANKA